MTYMAYTRKNFLGRSAYRFDHFMGIFNTCLQIFIFFCIYKALYGGWEEIDGITFSMVTTNFVLSLGLSEAFSIDEFYLPYRIGTGSIGNELLKPLNYKGIMLSEDFGNVLFLLLFHFFPALGIAALTVGVMGPASFLSFLEFLCSVVLGFFILWTLDFMVQTLSFWIINIWSVVTIKNVFVHVLSGAMFPLWFLPDWMKKIVDVTPFSSIYFTPVQIYLGKIGIREMPGLFFRQLLWIFFLWIAGEILWRLGIRKLVVQGG